MKIRHCLPLGLAMALVSAQSRAVLPFQAPIVNPIADTFVDSNEPDDNFGTAGLLAIAPNTPRSPMGEFDSFLKFDLAGTKTVFDDMFGVGHWVVQSIVLEVTATPPNNALFNGNGLGPGGTNVNAPGSFTIKWLQNNSWLEGNGAPSAPDMDPGDLNFTNHTNYFTAAADETLGTYSFNGATSGMQDFTLGLPPSFTADVTSGGVATLYVAAADLNINYLFHSGNFKNGPSADWPTLFITAVPEPGTFGFTVAGAALLAGRLRWR
jgi:hypothetical protein